jgi:Xaa-Pro aminopeptidase
MGIDALGFPGQPSHPVCHGVGARAHEPPYAHQAGGGEVTEGMVLAIEPGCYVAEGGGLRVEDNFLITADGAEKLSPFPDGIVRT